MKLWTNGTFYTMEKEGATTDAVLTDQGKIVAVGQEAILCDAAEKVDLDGAIVFPGFVDSHLHLLWYGQFLDRLRLTDTASKQEALARIAERVEKLAPDEWLFVEGYDENKWQDQSTLLTRDELDQVSAGHPVLVRRIDYHSVSVNSALIEATGLTADANFTGGGAIDTDETGRLTGVLRDNATTVVIDAFPVATREELGRWLRLAVRDLWAKGVTGGHSEDLHYFNGFKGTLAAFRDTLTEDFPFRAHLLVHNAELEAFCQSGEQFVSGDPFLELGAMKIFYDGTVGSRTALMSRPYADDPENQGLQIQSDEEFEAMVKRARDAGLPVAIHILGDLAFQKVIRTLKKFPPQQGQLDRMIHTPWLRDDLLEEAAGMPICFDLQPQFMSSDLPWALDVLGSEHPERAFAWKTLIDRGFQVSFGSDAPIETPNPFYGIHAAVTRTASQDLNGRRYFEEEALSVYEAIHSYTAKTAAISYKQGERGKIAPGYAADFTMTRENPFEVEEARLRELEVVRTVVAGRTVFEK
ncbi:amidohydrolase [Listeria costaricensis]|uniref:amidohydrolase n=1 Tax=Listeria costaricensis TaxID=2026604 RepID=UPI000C0819C9|nr:amidohydrolase [Listeria costaricensis]